MKCYNNKVKNGPYAFDYNGYEVIYLNQGNGPLYKLKVFVKREAETDWKFGCKPEERKTEEIINYGIINLITISHL